MQLNDSPGYVELHVGDERLESGRRYQVAFVNEQGVPARYRTDPQKSAVRAVDALMHLFAGGRPVEAELSGSVVFVSERIELGTEHEKSDNQASAWLSLFNGWLAIWSLLSREAQDPV